MHHDPLHNDDKMLEIEQLARELSARYPQGPHVFCAYEGCDLIIAQSFDKLLAQPAHHAPSIKPERRRTVLVADDDISIHLLAEAALTRDYDVVTAEDGEECLAILRNSAPDIIVLDLNMPVLDGLTVLKTLRGDPRLTHLPVLVLTASGDESSTRAAFEAGATDYLTKPFTIPQLTTRVTTCFAHTVAPSLPKA